MLVLGRFKNEVIVIDLTGVLERLVSKEGPGLLEELKDRDGRVLITIGIGDIRKQQRGDKTENNVHLGIIAPKHIPVHRREIWDTIQKEEREKVTQDDKPE